MPSSRVRLRRADHPAANERYLVGVFRRGDTAGVYIALADKDWEQHAIAIPETGDTIEVKSE